MHQPFEITIQASGIGGKLSYICGEQHYVINVEHTGDYSKGYLVFIRELDEQIQGLDKMQIKSAFLRDLQSWSKETGQKVCW